MSMKQNLIFKAVLILLLSTLCGQMKADTLINGIYYKLYDNDKTAMLTSISDKSATSVEIPATVEYNNIEYTVTHIGYKPFEGCSAITSLKIDDSDEPLYMTNLYYDAGDYYETTSLELWKLENLYLGRNIINRFPERRYYRYSPICSAFKESSSTLSTLTIGPKVNTLNERLFMSMQNLTVVNLPHVKTIEKEAFEGCSRLRTLNLGDELDSIGESAFSDCYSLTNLTFPSTIRTIGTSAFEDCSSITSISFPSDCNLENIGVSAFNGCSALTAFLCPNTVTSIGGSAFKDCRKLVTITLSDKIKAIDYETFRNDVVLTDMTIPEGVTSIEYGAFYNCTGIVTYSLPSTLKTIGSSVFYKNTGLVRLNIPGSVQSIGENSLDSCTNLVMLSFEDGDTICEEKAFLQDCPLRTVYIGRDLKYDSQNKENGRNRYGYTQYKTMYSPFYGMESLVKVNFSKNDKVKQIWDNLFRDCINIKSISLPQSLRSIGQFAFSGLTNLKEISTYDNVETIGASCFEGCTALESAKLSKNLKALNDRVFYGCSSLDNFIVPDSVSLIGISAFDGCTSLSSLTASVKTINESAFNGCTKLSTVSLTGNTLGAYAFNNCTNLLTASIEENTIDQYAFNECSKLKDVSITGNSIGKYAFYKCSDLTNLNIYKVTNIADGAFNECKSISNITFGDGTNDLTIGNGDGNGMFHDAPVEKLYLGRNLVYQNSPFYGIHTLDSLTLGKTLTNIGMYAFADCDALPEVNMPDNIKSIGRSAFDGCTSLRTVVLSDSLVSVGERAFKDCITLEKIMIPNTLDALSSETFAGCTSLSDVDLGEKLNTIGPSAFKGCTQLKGITIPKSVYGFGVESFSGCTSLQFINLTEGIKSIGKNAFNGCTGLKGVEFSKNLVSIGEGAFTGCNELKMIRTWAEIPPEGLPNFSDTVYNTAVVYAPENSIEDYKESPTWEKFFKFSPISNDIKVSSLTIDKDSITLNVNETETLTARVDPSFATNTVVNWSSSDESVATVDTVGIVTAIGNGSAVIIASSADGELKDTCKVNVVTPVTSISLNDNIASIKVGETKQLTATILPSTATNKNVVWSTSDETICTVDNDGLVTAVSTGDCVITVRSEENNEIYAECSITVTGEATGIINLTNDTASGDSEVYNVNGQRRKNLSHGVNIIKRDGTIKKIMVK